METGFKSLNRRQLQELCKKHRLPARTTNSKMAQSLAILQPEIIQSQEKNKPRGCLKGSGGSSDAPKTVTFTSEVEVRSFARTPKKGDGMRRKVRRRKVTMWSRTEGVRPNVELPHSVNSSNETAETEGNRLDDGGCTTRSLRNRVVVIVGCSGGRRRKKRRPAEGVEDGGLHSKGEGDHAVEKTMSSQVSGICCLRSRGVAVGGEEALNMGGFEQGRTRKRRRFAIRAEDVEVSLNGKSGETEVAEKNDMHDEPEGTASALEVVSKEGGLKVLLRGSRRTLSNPGTNEAGVEEAYLAGVADAGGDDGVAVGSNKSSQKLGDNGALVPDRVSLTEISPSQALKGSEIRELTRRSSRCSRRNALRHEITLDEKVATQHSGGSVREVIANSGPKYEVQLNTQKPPRKHSQLEGSSKRLTRSSARRF